MRRLGSRPHEWAALAERTYPLYMLGRWDEALATAEDFTQEQVDAGGTVLSVLQTGVLINIHRGELERARRVFEMFARLETSTDVQELSSYLASRSSLHLAEGRLSEALADGQAAMDAARTFGIASQSAKEAIVNAMDAVLALGEIDRLERLLALIEGVPTGTRPPYLDAQARRFRARINGDPAGYAAAEAGFRQLGLPFWLAVTLLEHAELTGDDELLGEAREIFEGLDARPWLDRIAAGRALQA